MEAIHADLDAVNAAFKIDHSAMPRLGDIPSYFAQLRPSAVAMTFDGQDTTWRMLDARANMIAHALKSSGCKPGDRIAIVSKNCAELYELLFGAARAGVIFTPVIHRLSPNEVAGIIKDCNPSMIFVGEDHAGHVDAYGAAVAPETPIIGFENVQGVQKFSEWRNAKPDAPVGEDAAASDVALQLYTSGTTGKPKGVMLTHDNILSGRRDGMIEPMSWNEWEEGDVNLVALPNGHIGGVGWGIVGFFNGARTIVHRDFDPGAVLEAIDGGGVTKLFMVPTALQILLMHPNVRDMDYSRLRYILYGAAPIALDLLRECTEVFRCGFCQQYGMTETCGTIVYLPPEDHDANGNTRMRSAGKPMPGVELRIVDEQGDILPANETGEIETRSVANMRGYWNQPEQTAAAIAGDGWLKTGDAGFLDEDGYLFIQDRIKDMICSGAENVYPAEVESAIYGHDAIQEVAVIGVPDEKWGEAVKAVVVLRPGAEAAEADIINWARSRIAAFKAPKSVDFVSTLPRNASGKILRRDLRAPYWAGKNRQVN